MEGKVIYIKPDVGFAYWLKPIRNMNLFQIKEKVNSELVSFNTPDRFSYDSTISGIRVGYASLSEANLEKGIRILSKYL